MLLSEGFCTTPAPFKVTPTDLFAPEFEVPPDRSFV
jgi:hypothetical protein